MNRWNFHELLQWKLKFAWMFYLLFSLGYDVKMDNDPFLTDLSLKLQRVCCYCLSLKYISKWTIWCWCALSTAVTALLEQLCLVMSHDYLQCPASVKCCPVQFKTQILLLGINMLLIWSEMLWSWIWSQNLLSLSRF